MLGGRGFEPSSFRVCWLRGSTGPSSDQRSSRGVADSPTSFLKMSTSAERNDCFTLRSSTRSCGRRGPATLGVTVARSNSSVSVNFGSSVLASPETLFLAVPLDQIDLPRIARSGACTPAFDRRPGKIPWSRRIPGPCWRSSRGPRRSCGQAFAVKLDELFHHAVRAKNLRDDQHQVGGSCALGQLRRAV